MKPYLAFAFFVSVILILIGLSVSAAPFVTPGMMKRNGLTDEQYQQLWAIGARPQIDIAAARDWMYRANRYTNVVDWLDICGKSNDFAKLSHKLQGDNFVLEETNKIVRAENAVLVETNAVLTISAEKAWKVEKAADKAKKKDQKNFEKWVKDTEKAKAKSSEEMAEFYDSVLELANAYTNEN